MIKSLSEPSPYQTCFTNGSDICVADSGPGSGGAYGFQPRELLEAALATSMNIAIRMIADRHRLAIDSVEVQVSLTQDEFGRSALCSRIDIGGALTELEHRRLLQAAEQCPIARLLQAGVRCGADAAVPPATVAATAFGVDSHERVGNRASFVRRFPIDGRDPLAHLTTMDDREAEQA